MKDFWKLILQKDYDDPKKVMISALHPPTHTPFVFPLAKGDVTYFQLQGRLVKIEVVQ